MANTILFLAGLLTLVVGASALVRGSSRLALRLGLSPLVVGLTVVAFGTSAPELAVSADAVLSGQGGMALGNVVGSNIFNSLFILGLAAVITPLAVHRQVVRQEAPIMIGAGALVILLGQDGGYGWIDGAALLLLLIGYTVFLVRQSRTNASAGREADTSVAEPTGRQKRWDERLGFQVLLIAAGLGLLMAGSEMLVTSALVLARAMGLSETVIGLTIVAAGTSLPEVAASVAASLKGERDIAIGNVVGSCIFNLLGVLGLAALLTPLAGIPGLLLSPEVANFDLWVMLAASIACLPVFLSGREIVRWEGLLLLGCYAAYMLYVVLTAQRHPDTATFGKAMVWLVLPLTVFAVGATWVRRPTRD